MKIVAVDVDGVVANLAEIWLDRYNKDYNDDMKVEDWIDWDVEKLVKPECGKRIFRYIEDPGIYDDVKPYPGALARINELKMYFRVIFVTTSTFGASGKKYRWLREWKFIKEQDDYVECKDKSLIYSHFLIDDNIENITKPVPYGNRVNILFSQPWNKKFEYTPRMLNWNSFYDFK